MTFDKKVGPFLTLFPSEPKTFVIGSPSFLIVKNSSTKSHGNAFAMSLLAQQYCAVSGPAKNTRTLSHAPVPPSLGHITNRPQFNQ